MTAELGGVGWYPYPSVRDPHQQAYWNGQKWSEYRTVVSPVGSVSPAPALIPAAPRPRPAHVSGTTTGQAIVYVVLALPTCGLSLLWWAARAFLDRKRVA
jgi:hypothetical protein